MAKNWNKLEQMGVKKPVHRKPNKYLLWYILSGIALAALAITAFFVIQEIKKETYVYTEPNNNFSIDLPKGWRVPEYKDVLQFSAGLDIGDFAYMFVPNNFDVMTSQVDNILTVAAFKKPENVNKIKEYSGRIGGVTDPYGLLTERIYKEGTKLKNIDGYYTLKYGFPIGRFENSKYVFILHGNIADSNGKQLIEKMINSIR